MTKIGGALAALALCCAACHKDHDRAYNDAGVDDGAVWQDPSAAGQTPSAGTTASDVTLNPDQAVSAQHTTEEEAGSPASVDPGDAGADSGASTDDNTAEDAATSEEPAESTDGDGEEVDDDNRAPSSEELGCAGPCGLGLQGATCEQDDDCLTGLACRIAEVTTDARGQRQEVRACTHACTPGGNQCAAGEKCQSLNGAADQYACLSVWNVPFTWCGASLTAVCSDDLECRRIPADQSYGICVQPCQLNAPQCPNGFTCQNVLDESSGRGICIRTAERGWPCGIQLGLSCGAEDLCVSDGTIARCLQNCTETHLCQSGLCRRLDADTRYCDN